MAEYNQPTTNIWFPLQKEPIYDPTNEESNRIFKEYWKIEKDRCINGFLLGGQVKVPGRLYWHTVYWKIAAYITKVVNNVERKPREIITPLLLDTVWDIFEDLDICTDEGRFYNLIGSRDFGKSITAASCAGWQYTFFSKSEAVISGGAVNYIKLATDKIEDGLINIHPIFKKQRLTSDWKKEIVAGWKDKATNLADPRSSGSSIKVRNYENGNKTMAANGTRPGFHLIDETGTIPNLISCFKDSDGCWWSGGGNKPSCLVMLAGTGGNMEIGADAAEMFFKPEAYNFLAFPNPENPNGKIGRFVSALRAKMNYKEEWTLYDYFTKKLGRTLTPHPELDVKILVSNEERAYKEWWKPEYNKAIKSGNSKTLLKFKAYWCLKPSDSFIVLTKNDYNTEAAAKQKRKLETEGNVASLVELFHDGENIKHKFSEKLPITEFPVKTQSKDAPIQIWEFPISETPPFGLYVAGVDNYRQGKATYSDSLGSVVIFKRMHDINSELYQDVFVASYCARPDNVDIWSEQARLLIKFYNARTLCENDDMTFINYMISKGDGHYLEDQPEWIRTYVPNTTSTREKGVHRSAQAIRDMLRAGLKRYLDEIIHVEYDAEGSIVKETLGVTRIPDPMFLEEIIKFNEDSGNYDREVAYSLAIAMRNHLDPIIGRVLSKNDVVESIFRRPIKGNKLFLPVLGRKFHKSNKLFNR